MKIRPDSPDLHGELTKSSCLSRECVCVLISYTWHQFYLTSGITDTKWLTGHAFCSNEITKRQPSITQLEFDLYHDIGANVNSPSHNQDSAEVQDLNTPITYKGDGHSLTTYLTYIHLRESGHFPNIPHLRPPVPN